MGPLVILLGVAAAGGLVWAAKKGESSSGPVGDGTLEIYVSAIMLPAWPQNAKDAILLSAASTPRDGENALTYPNRLATTPSTPLPPISPSLWLTQSTVINSGPFKIPARSPLEAEQEALLKVANVRVGLTDQGARPVCVYAYDSKFNILAYEGLTKQGARWIYGFPSRNGSKWTQDSAMLENTST